MSVVTLEPQPHPLTAALDLILSGDDEQTQAAWARADERGCAEETFKDVLEVAYLVLKIVNKPYREVKVSPAAMHEIVRVYLEALASFEPDAPVLQLKPSGCRR